MRNAIIHEISDYLWSRGKLVTAISATGDITFQFYSNGRRDGFNRKAGNVSEYFVDSQGVWRIRKDEARAALSSSNGGEQG